MKYAIALIVFKPNDIYLSFLNSFIHYDIYIIIDDNSVLYGKQYQDKYKNINFIQIRNIDCKNAGYINSNMVGIKKLISGWDKALYFFTFMNTNYNNIWFIEDDVFFYNETTLSDIDNTYVDSNYDLLANCDFQEGKYNEWLWSIIQINLPKPFYAGMMCAIRVSSNLLEGIRNYATKYKTLFFIEALFPTIVKHNNLSFFQPIELTKIQFREKWTILDIDKKHLFHPIKNLQMHQNIRNGNLVM
jgi:hypothetical protein